MEDMTDPRAGGGGSNPDEPAYFCADCLAELPLVCADEESCPKCGKDICCEKDFLTEVQWTGRIKEWWDLWDAAVRDGLIADPERSEAATLKKRTGA